MIKTLIAASALQGVALAHKTAETHNLVYGVFKEECFAKLEADVSSFINDSDCVKFSISKLIGYVIILGAVIVKVPQIIKILANCSTKGINSYSYYVETTQYMQIAAYAMHLNLQFSVYGENLFLVAQNIAIVLLMWHFDHSIAFFEKLIFSAFYGAYATALFGGYLPEHAWAFVSSSSLMMSFAARIPQIIQNYKDQSTGHLAFITFFMMFAGSIARAATVLFESDDVMLRAQYALGLLLNFLIIVQFGLYWNNKEGEKAKTEAKKPSVYTKVNPLPDTKKTK